MKPVMLSTAICQRPGTSSRFMPPATKTQTRTAVNAIHNAELVNAMLNPSSKLPVRPQQGLDGELLHRIDLAFFGCHGVSVLKCFT